MGLRCPLKKIAQVIYKAEMANGLTEYEFDHILVGQTDEIPKINREEAKSWRYASRGDLDKELAKNGNRFTPWFKIVLDELIKHDYI